MKTIPNLFVAAALFLCANTAWSETRFELAQDYTALPAVQSMMTDMFSPAASAAQFRASLPPGVEVTDDQAARVGEIMSGVLMGLKPRMEELQTAAIAEVFTEDEIRAMIDFHSTELGGSILIKTQPMFQKVMGELTPQIIEAMGAKQGEIAAIMSGE